MLAKTSVGKVILDKSVTDLFFPPDTPNAHEIVRLTGNHANGSSR